MAYDYGNVTISDLIYSHSMVYNRNYTFESGNNKNLCLMKFYTSANTYDMYITSPSIVYTYSSGNVADNVDDYFSQDRGGSVIHFKSNYRDYIEYPPHPIATEANRRTSLREGNISDSIGENVRWLNGCNIPIYTISTNEDFGKVNRYIQTGDDSEADNYSDLHPTLIHIHVKIDGNSFPNFYIWSELEGSAVNSFTYDNVGSNIGIIYSDTSNGSLTVNTMNSFTYGEMYADYKKGGTTFRCAELGDNPNDYVGFEWNGSGYSSVRDTSENGKLTLSVEYGVPTEEDYPEDNNPWTDTNDTNTFSASNKLTETYKLTDAKLVSLGNFFWSSTFKDNIMALCNYPLENVIALKAMPIVLSGTEKEIKIGNVSSGITADKVSGADNYEVTVGTIFIPEYFQNFIDYSSVNLQIYLPFIGYKELDNLLCMNRWLRVRYVFDVIMGTCMACLDVKDINGTYMQYQCYQGNCGIDIAITSTNRASIENGYINAGLDTVSDILRGDVGGAVKDVFNASTQDFHSQSNGAGNPSLMNRLSNACYVIVRRPKKYDLPSNYGHTYGYPYFKKKTLSSLTGFTVCENFDCAIAGATDVERSEIKQLLENGVYITEVV